MVSSRTPCRSSKPLASFSGCRRPWGKSPAPGPSAPHSAGNPSPASSCCLSLRSRRAGNALPPRLNPRRNALPPRSNPSCQCAHGIVSLRNRSSKGDNSRHTDGSLNSRLSACSTSISLAGTAFALKLLRRRWCPGEVCKAWSFPRPRWFGSPQDCEQLPRCSLFKRRARFPPPAAFFYVRRKGRVPGGTGRARR